MIMPVNSPHSSNLIFRAIQSELQRTSTNLNGQDNSSTKADIKSAHHKNSMENL